MSTKPTLTLETAICDFRDAFITQQAAVDCQTYYDINNGY